ncbi:hypothetical protein [Chlorobaculum limnaeum]|uniref:hypothetical protein n=1 Tax=Chlorobaculum limnaeum TaxID=274537 RepID=UPI00196A1136|nr:hypothetical protein [Chlorobaculum limnaeum]
MTVAGGSLIVSDAFELRDYCRPWPEFPDDKGLPVSLPVVRFLKKKCRARMMMIASME